MISRMISYNSSGTSQIVGSDLILRLVLAIRGSLFGPTDDYRLKMVF